MSKSIPIIADKKPIKVDLESGKNYFWCRCGKSQQQPFCDGSHICLLYTSPSPRDVEESRMPSSA